MIHNLPVYPPSNSFQSGGKGLRVVLIGCTFCVVFWSLSEIVRRGPRWPWTWDGKKKHWTLICSPLFHSSTTSLFLFFAAIFSFCPLLHPFVSQPRQALNMQDCPSTILGIARSRDRTHSAHLPSSLSLVLPLQHSVAMVLGSVSANDFRKKCPPVKKEKKG